MSELKKLIIIRFNKYDVKKTHIDIPKHNKTIQDLHDYVWKEHDKTVYINMIYYINNGNILDEKTDLNKLNKDILLLNIESLVSFHGSSLTTMINQLMFNGSLNTSNFNAPILNLNGVFNLTTSESGETSDTVSVVGGPGFNDPIPSNDEHFGDNPQSSLTEPETTPETTQNADSLINNISENLLNPNEFIVNNEFVSRQLLNTYGANINYNEIKDKYSDEYTTMFSMGFTNINRALQALQICEGDIEKAVNYYLSE